MSLREPEVSMRWLKLFVFLRLPMSVVTLLGFTTLNVWQEPGMGFFGVVFVVGLLVYLRAVSVKLYRRRPGALTLAGWLLLLEVLGAVLAVGWDEISRGRNLGKVAIWAWVVLLLWTLLGISGSSR
jgi:hypothetical protein